MSSQTKLIKDILSIYNTILENKEVEEAVDVYDNVDFKDIGHGNPASDNASDKINTILLQDVQTAAKKAGLNVDITTAISGHKKSKSERHPDGNAVDISIINGIGSGKATNATNGNQKFRELGNKLKDVLVSMGYVWNSEVGNPKAVLWQTDIGGNHYNHVHVSNTTSSPSDTSDTSNTSNTSNSSDTSNSSNTSNTSNTSDTSNDEYLKKREAFKQMFGKVISSAIGVNENVKNVDMIKNKSYKKIKLEENIQRIKGLL
jgi:hypothetical protein